MINVVAYEENQRNRAHIQERQTPKGKVLVVDGFNARYQGVLIADLGRVGRRKFENRVFLQHLHEHPREKVKIVYI